MIRLSFLLLCLLSGKLVRAEEVLGVLTASEMALVHQLADRHHVRQIKGTGCIKREFLLESTAKDLGVTQWVIKTPASTPIDGAVSGELSKIAARLQIPAKDTDLITRKRLIRAIEDSCGQRPPWYFVYEIPEEDEYAGPAVSRSGDRLVLPSEDAP